MHNVTVKSHCLNPIVPCNSTAGAAVCASAGAGPVAVVEADEKNDANLEIVDLTMLLVLFQAIQLLMLLFVFLIVPRRFVWLMQSKRTF